MNDSDAGLNGFSAKVYELDRETAKEIGPAVLNVVQDVACGHVFFGISEYSGEGSNDGKILSVFEIPLEHWTLLMSTLRKDLRSKLIDGIERILSEGSDDGEAM